MIYNDRFVQPFGESSSTTGTLTYNLGAFPGQYFDSESNLYYNGPRFYDQTTSNYDQPDPIGLRGTTPAVRSLYPYASQNPVKLLTPQSRGKLSLLPRL
jgi:RHS repeat-associated protein